MAAAAAITAKTAAAAAAAASDPKKEEGGREKTSVEGRFKEVYCSDCKRVLARYSTKYFTDADINELVHIHYSSHIREGHDVGTRLVPEKG